MGLFIHVYILMVVTFYIYYYNFLITFPIYIIIITQFYIVNLFINLML